MKVLVSGFEVFDGHSINPSQELATRLKSPLNEMELKTIVLPVSFKDSFSVLEDEIKNFGPDVIIGTGLAASRENITVERIAINIIEARIPDNDGWQPVGERIVENEPDGLFSQLPLSNIISYCKEKGSNVVLSNSAGTYVCNYLMFQIVHHAKKNGLKGGFVHLPIIAELSGNHSHMKMSQVINDFENILRALVLTSSKTSNSGVED